MMAISFFAVLLLYSGCVTMLSISKSWCPELHRFLLTEEQSLPVLLIVYSPTRIFDSSFLTQCAAVTTYRSPIRDPPQCQCIGVSLVMFAVELYPKRASQG